jgi:NAD-dependent deacetylase
MSERDSVAALAADIQAADSVIALSGAGVSAASGIPTFRGEDGVWNEFDPNSFHRRRLDADPEGFWRDRLELRDAFYGDIDPEPNAAHTALASLESEGLLDAVLTQNVDGLHTAAGSERVVELHGTHRRVRCDDCGERRSADPVFERADEGALPPRCDCGGVYRPDVVLFGESLADAVLEAAQRLARESDVFLAVGSSLSVRPASLLPRIADESGATLAVVNLDPTPQDERAAYLFQKDVTDVLPALAEAV